MQNFSVASDENRVAYIFLISRNMTTSQINTTYILFMLFCIDIAFGNKMEETSSANFSCLLKYIV